MRRFSALVRIYCMVITGGALLAALLTLAAAGIFGACLPVVRELGRPTRLASAIVAGSVALGVVAGVASTAGLSTLRLPLLIVPLVVTSFVAARILCRLPESPGPENAYPGFPAIAVVVAATLLLAVSLTSGGPAAGRPTDVTFTTSTVDALRIVARGIGALPGSEAPGGVARLMPVVWLLVALPLVAALLSLHVPLRRGWAIAALWYAAMSIVLALWHTGAGSDGRQGVFVTLAALAAFGCAKEPRLVAFAAIALCGAALPGGEALAACAAIVAGSLARDIREGWRTAATRNLLLLAGPAVALLARAGDGLAGSEPGTALPPGLTTGLFGLGWMLPVLAIAAMFPRRRNAVVTMLPILAPAATLAIALGLTVLSTGDGAAFAARAALSMLVLAAGLALRTPSRHARASQRPATAR